MSSTLQQFAHADGRLRLLLGEGRQQVRQQAVARRAVEADDQLLATGAARDANRAVSRGKRSPRLTQERSAGCGQLNIATGAVKQGHAELRLEPADLLAEPTAVHCAGAPRPGLALIAGGIPVVAGGRTAGAIGVAGAMTGADDRRIAEAAVATIAE